MGWDNEKTPSIPTNREEREWDEDFALKQELAKRVMPETEEEKAKALEPLADSPALNRLLLRNARKSLNEIAATTGMPVAEVAERLSALLDNRSWRDDLMEEKLLLAEVGMLVEDIRERMSRFGVDDEGWASMARVQLQAIKTLLEQVEKRRKAVDGQLSVMTTMQAQMIADAIKLNNELTVEALARKHGLLEEEVYAEWEDNFPRAIEMLEARARD
jgi:hypothetical protein